MRVTKNDRTISTIGKHIIAQHTLASGGVGVGIDETGYFGIVITGLQIVELSLGIKNIATVAQGVHICQGVGGGENVAVAIGMTLAPSGNPRIPAGGVILFDGNIAVSLSVPRCQPWALSRLSQMQLNVARILFAIF